MNKGLVFPKKERDVLRRNLIRSRPGHEVVLSSEDALKLLDAYESWLPGRRSDA